MKPYDFKKIEQHWQKQWEEQQTYKTGEDTSKEKVFVLGMFPYPSGEGLHTGHVKIFTASDIYARKKRMEGYNVLFPTGWDAFGLPAEQFAIKNKIHPRISTDNNVNNFRRQMKILSLSYDFNREVDTTDPAYYKWTQWIFLKMYEKGLAFESYDPINWCPSCETGLANEDLEAGKCERCGSIVEKKKMRQWTLRITDYAERLLHDLDTLPKWPEWLKELERNWIGKSEGAEFDFELEGAPVKSVKIFTTRPDTLFGATFVAISAELADEWLKNGWEAEEDIHEYVAKTLNEQKEILEHGKEREKTGIFADMYAINPTTKEKIPVWIANYVLSGVGTGAIMAVPAHDERDFEFAFKYNIPIKEVIVSEKSTLPEKAFVGEGTLINSETFDGMKSEEAKHRITEHFKGKPVTRYKLQDWVFSRQRYWGEPIPIVHDEEGKAYPLDVSELPLTLPEVEHYAPSGTGESPLATITDWVNVRGIITEKGTFKQDNNGTNFRRETNTMPQWAGSSWYYLRFADPNNTKELISKEAEKYWQPVDRYVGGAEHATRHLIYARFWHKFLYDIGIVSQMEPFLTMESVGLVLGPDGQKMSKRRGNIVNPDDVVKEWGSDAVRLYSAFMGSFYDATPWNKDAIVGCARFLEKVWKVSGYVKEESIPSLETIFHKTVKKVTEDIEVFKFNTAISSMMIFLNSVDEEKAIGKAEWKAFLQILAPFTPSIAEELWKDAGFSENLHTEGWPVYDSAKTFESEITMPIQINGKLRGTFIVPFDSSDEEVKTSLFKTLEYEKYVGKNEPKKVIIVKNRLVNIVI
ncbi:MAG: leucyl-tRNA synthetase [Patescibacteria group bacterium]|nr:leucyl-tRNA synthetase [Patescibacteria group bacterium]